MNETKTWGQSQTIIASIVTILALIAGLFNINIDLQTQGDIVQLGTVIIGVFSSIIAIYGRIRANTLIK
jgi:predicted nucleic acid-binding protein